MAGGGLARPVPGGGYPHPPGGECLLTLVGAHFNSRIMSACQQSEQVSVPTVRAGQRANSPTVRAGQRANSCKGKGDNRSARQQVSATTGQQSEQVKSFNRTMQRKVAPTVETVKEFLCSQNSMRAINVI